MCGRFALFIDPAELLQWFGLMGPAPAGLTPRQNVAPGEPVVAITQTDRPQAEWFQWGLIPAWATDPQIGRRLINARAETAAVKPAFRAAFKQRRCLIPATGFYEWRSVGKTKQPVLFQMKEAPLLALAGLWESWRAPDGATRRTVTILTTAPNDLVAPVHDRMPVILKREAYALWLAARPLTPEEWQPLGRPFPAAQMKMSEAPALTQGG